MGTSEEALDVGPGDLGEVGTTLVRREAAALPHCPQQGHRQCTGPDTGLDDVRSREDVGHPDDVRAVLRVDDLRASWHRQHEVGEQRALREVGRGADRHRDAVGPADEVVVLEDPLVGVELLAGLQGDGVHPTLGIGQLHLVPLAQGSTAAFGFVAHRD